MAPKRKLVSLGKNSERDYSASNLFSDATQEITDGANPFPTTIFEASFDPISTLTLRPRRGKPIRVHDVHGRIDEEAFSATENDLRTLGIYPDLQAQDSAE